MRIPERGDLIKLDFDNTQGHEQSGYRRAIVITLSSYNRVAGLAVVCAITNQKKGYPFEVDIPEGLKVTGVILSDQIRTIDWVARNIIIVDHAPQECVEEIQKNLSKLL